jgi:hypothetical protein
LVPNCNLNGNVNAPFGMSPTTGNGVGGIRLILGGDLRADVGGAVPLCDRAPDDLGATCG